MEHKQNPAYDVLSELNDHYSKTQDPDTALKIISLVEYALKYELEPHCRMKPEPEKGFLESIFGFKFGKKSIDEPEMHDPFHYYRMLAKERNESSKTHYFQNLNARFGVDATLKGKDWTRVVDVDERARDVYEAFFHSLPILAKNLSLFKLELGRLLSSKTICIDQYAYSNLSSMDYAVDGVATTIKELILTHADEYQRFNDVAYIDFFLDINKNFDCCLMETKLIHTNTLKVLRAIADERIRQILDEGYTIKHDDEHTDGSIANSAAHYICADENINLWTWDKNFDKKDKHSRDKQLLIGSAMTVAEMERRNRIEKMIEISKASPFVNRNGQGVEGVFEFFEFDRKNLGSPDLL